MDRAWLRALLGDRPHFNIGAVSSIGSPARSFVLPDHVDAAQSASLLEELRRLGMAG